MEDLLNELKFTLRCAVLARDSHRGGCGCCFDYDDARREARGDFAEELLEEIANFKSET